MVDNPFRLFSQFRDRLGITVFTRADAYTDTLALRTLGGESGAALWQVHGSRTVIVREPTARIEKADGMATDIPGLVLSIRWADCQNFLIYSPKHHVLGAVHAGWRGLLAGAIPEHFRVLEEEWGIAPEETYVAAGPSLCLRCSDFTDSRKELPGIEGRFFHGKLVDLRGIADAQLDAAGVPRDHRERMGGCTRCDHGTFFSYRGGDREAVLAGSTNAIAGMLR